MKISMDKYRFYTSDNKVIAVSSYAGKPVRGIAKCDPVDTFSLEDGKALAVARCNEKIAEKRYKRAKRKYDEACTDYLTAHHYLGRMSAYLTDAYQNLVEARENASDVLNKIAP